jgi:hypothetical protein
LSENMILQTSEERIKLLKSGFTGNQVEALYIDLNHFEIVKVNWDSAATKRTRRIRTTSSFMNLHPRPTILEDCVRVQAAPSQGLRA